MIFAPTENQKSNFHILRAFQFHRRSMKPRSLNSIPASITPKAFFVFILRFDIFIPLSNDVYRVNQRIVTSELYSPIAFFILYDIGKNSSGGESVCYTLQKCVSFYLFYSKVKLSLILEANFPLYCIQR